MSGRWSGLLRGQGARLSPLAWAVGVGYLVLASGALAQTSPATTAGSRTIREAGEREQQPSPSPGAAAPDLPFVYPAKVVCGLQKDPKSTKLVRGFYGSAINVFNPGTGDKPAHLRKELALTSPPEEEKPGKVFRIAEEDLGSGEALEVDCLDLAREVFGGDLPEPFIKGFVVIRSTNPLGVTGVYTSASIDRQGEIESVTGIDVVEIHAAKSKVTANQCPDLTVTDISGLSVVCPGGAGTCVTKFNYTVRNIGLGDAGQFTVRSVADPAAAVIVDQLFPSGLAAGAMKTVPVATPPGGNCFDPDCMISVTADINNQVNECNENNNTRAVGTIG
jgi:hypothetical protein